MKNSNFAEVLNFPSRILAFLLFLQALWLSFTSGLVHADLKTQSFHSNIVVVEAATDYLIFHYDIIEEY